MRKEKGDVANSAWIYISCVASLLGSGYLFYRCYQDRLKRPFACSVQLFINVFCSSSIVFMSSGASNASVDSENAAGMNLFFLMLQSILAYVYCSTAPRVIHTEAAGQQTLELLSVAPPRRDVESVLLVGSHSGYFTAGG